MDRLKRDGALSREAIRRRLQWVAYDRKLAPAEITKAMRTRNIVAFCKKYGVSLDWVLYGICKVTRRSLGSGRRFSRRMNYAAHTKVLAKTTRRSFRNT
jgi:hypothetical protein